MTDDERWNRALERAREMLEIYKHLPRGAGIFGAVGIAECISLYESGDRSEALLERLEGIE